MADLERKYNLKSPAVKRLMREAAELKEPHQHYHAQPLEDNLFEWHFTVRGPADSDFDGGRYHGRIVLPPEYPMKPPSIILITPNGRFELGKKICLSMSAHHPETWQPSWSIRTVLLALIGFMPTKGGGAIGALDYSSQERKVLAMRSLEWKCDTCGVESSSALADTHASSEERADSDEAKELASQISFKGETEKPVSSQESTDSSVSAIPPLPQQLPTCLADPALSHPAGFQAPNNFAQAYQHFASCMYQSPMFRNAPPNQVQFPYNFLNQYGMYNQQYPGSIPTAGIVTPPQNIGYNRASSLSSVSSSTANGSIASEVERKTSVCEPDEEAPLLLPTDAATASAPADSVSSGPLLSNRGATTESCIAPLAPDGLRHRTGPQSSADKVVGAASKAPGPVPLRPAQASGSSRRSTFDFATVVLMWIIAVLLIILVLRRLAMEKSSMLQQ